MTVDECAKKLAHHFRDANRLALGLSASMTIEELSAAIIGALHALILTESVRAAELALVEASHVEQLVLPAAKSPDVIALINSEIGLLNELAASILATSPGKGGG